MTRMGRIRAAGGILGSVSVTHPRVIRAIRG